MALDGTRQGSQEHRNVVLAPQDLQHLSPEQPDLFEIADAYCCSKRPMLQRCDSRHHSALCTTGHGGHVDNTHDDTYTVSFKIVSLAGGQMRCIASGVKLMATALIACTAQRRKHRKAGHSAARTIARGQRKRHKSVRTYHANRSANVAPSGDRQRGIAPQKRFGHNDVQ